MATLFFKNGLRYSTFSLPRLIHARTYTHRTQAHARGVDRQYRNALLGKVWQNWRLAMEHQAKVRVFTLRRFLGTWQAGTRGAARERSVVAELTRARVATHLSSWRSACVEQRSTLRLQRRVQHTCLSSVFSQWRTAVLLTHHPSPPPHPPNAPLDPTSPTRWV